MFKNNEKLMMFFAKASAILALVLALTYIFTYRETEDYPVISLNEDQETYKEFYNMSFPNNWFYCPYNQPNKECFSSCPVKYCDVVGSAYVMAYYNSDEVLTAKAYRTYGMCNLAQERIRRTISLYSVRFDCQWITL